MAVRECLSVIFLRAHPERGHDFLSCTKIATTPKDERPSTTDLAERHENELFHILFNEYPALNDLLEVKVQGLVQQIRESDSFEALRDLLAAFPIRDDDDSGFIAALKGLLDPIERVRNPVAHSREIPKRARDNYESARAGIWKRMAEFWAKHAEPDDLPPWTTR